MNARAYVTLRVEAQKIRTLERNLYAASNASRALHELGNVGAAVVDMDAAVASLNREVARIKRAMPGILKGEAVHEFMTTTHGLGPAVALFLGSALPMSEYPSPSHLLSYSGLGVVDGRAPRRRKGERARYSSWLQAIAIARIGDPAIKQVAGPYRAVYDARRVRTQVTHPLMLKNGEGCEHCDEAYAKTKAKRAGHNYDRERTAPAFECAQVGGVHWTAGHQHADARRVMVKQIVIDIWRVEHGMEPRFGVPAEHDEAAA